MSNYKPFEKDKMTIEKAIKILKEPPDFSLNYYNRENAIDVLLTAYEKEKEKNKKIDEINFRVNKNLMETAEKLESEKEKNKELELEISDLKWKYSKF